MVGSLPLETVEDVFRACKDLFPFLSSLPDGEIGERRFWTPYLPLRTFSSHPDLIEVSRPAWAAFLEEGRQELPTDGDVTEHWPFAIKDGVTELEFNDLHYASPSIESYRVFRTWRERGDLPHQLAFQVSLPSTDSVVEDYFPNRQDWERAKLAYERAAFREIAKMLEEIPAEDLVVQWDLAVEPVNIELVDNPWLSGSLSGDAREDGDSREATYARHMRSINELWRGVPEPVRLGYHWCYGTWGGWPMTEMHDLRLCVDLTNDVVAGAGRRVDFVHMPVTPDADEAFFAPLGDLDIGSTRVYLGLIHHDDPQPDGFRRRVELAKRYVEEFGVASVCGYGRTRRSEMNRIIDSHLAAVFQLAAR